MHKPILHVLPYTKSSYVKKEWPKLSQEPWIILFLLEIVKQIFSLFPKWMNWLLVKNIQHLTSSFLTANT